jgi:hypothetical protein
LLFLTRFLQKSLKMVDGDGECDFEELNDEEKEEVEEEKDEEDDGNVEDEK